MFCISAASRCARPLPHGFTGHVARPSRSILVVASMLLRFALAAGAPFETRSLPALARRYPRGFTFYVALPIRSIRRTITALGEPSFQRTRIIQSALARARLRIFRSARRARPSERRADDFHLRQLHR